MPQQTTVFLYSRVSTQEQKKGWSLKAQSEELRARPEACTAEIRLYTDTHTGADTRRPGLQEMISALKGAPNYVIVWRADRLSRHQEHFWSIVGRIHRAGATLIDHSTNSRSDSQPDRLILGISVAVAENERWILRSRTQAGQKQAADAGVHIGSPGFGCGIEDGRLILDPQEEILLRLIVEQRRQGKTLAAIASHLNEARIPCKKKGSQWYPSTVRSVLITAQKAIPWVAAALAIR